MTDAAGRLDAEVAFDAEDFQRVRTLIRARAGIDLHAGKKHMVYSRLARRLRERGHASFRSYLDALEAQGPAEWQHFINCLTTNLTAFFREGHHFEFLADALRQAPPRPRRIWSCAASTGEEPYSIAMTVVETLGPGHQVNIEASDIDTAVLDTAREGVYPLASAEPLGAARLKRFFLRGTGAREGQVRVRPELRSMVQVRAFNLLSTPWNFGPYDAVFCRNVMIYFDRPTQLQVLRRLHGCLRPGGMLFVGHSENFSECRELFELVGRTTYRKAGE